MKIGISSGYSEIATKVSVVRALFEVDSDFCFGRLCICVRPAVPQIECILQICGFGLGLDFGLYSVDF